MDEDSRQTANYSNALQLDSKLLRVGAALAAAGGLVWLAGVVLGSLALGAAAREWIQQLEQPPLEIAKSKWRQAIAAGAAGADAWSKGPPA
jgi:hypothetical protein